MTKKSVLLNSREDTTRIAAAISYFPFWIQAVKSPRNVISIRMKLIPDAFPNSKIDWIMVSRMLISMATENVLRMSAEMIVEKSVKKNAL